MPTSRRGYSDAEARARESQRKSERAAPGHYEFRCDICGLVNDEGEMKIQHGRRLCHSCYEPEGDVIDRDNQRAFASRYAAQRDASRRLPKYPYTLESAPAITEFTPNPVILGMDDIFGSQGTQGTLIIDGIRLNEVVFVFPSGVVVVSSTFNSDASSVTFVLEATGTSTAGVFPIYADGEAFQSKVVILEAPVDPDQTYLRLDGTNNGNPLTWLDTVTADLLYVKSSRQILVADPLTQNVTNLSQDMLIGIDTFTASARGVVPPSTGGTSKFLRADGTWITPPGSALFTPTTSGIVPASGGGTANYLRADGTWSTPSGGAGSWDGGTITNPIDAADGTASLPAYAFSGSIGLGMYADSVGGRLKFAVGEAAVFGLTDKGAFVASDSRLGWASSDVDSGTLDTFLGRNGVGGVVISAFAAATPASLSILADSANTAKNVSLSHNGTDSILNSNTGGLNIKAANSYTAKFTTTGLRLGSNQYLGWCGDTAPDSSAMQVGFIRGGSTIIDLKPLAGETYSQLRVWGVTGYGSIAHSDAANTTYIRGTGVAALGSFGDFHTEIISDSTPRWVFAASGGGYAFYPSANGTQGIGGASNRLMTIYTNGLVGDTNNGLEITKSYHAKSYDIAFAASNAIYWVNSNVQTTTLTGNASFSQFYNAFAGDRLVFIVKRTGAFTVTQWPANVVWIGGVAPVQSAVSGKVDIFSFIYDGSQYFGTYAIGFN